MKFSNRQRLILERLNRAANENRRVHQKDLETIPGIRTANALINTLVSLESRQLLVLTWDESAADRLVTITAAGRQQLQIALTPPPRWQQMDLEEEISSTSEVRHDVGD